MQSDISKHLHDQEGFCHPDGAAISAIIEQNHPEAEWKAAWEKVSQLWLQTEDRNQRSD